MKLVIVTQENLELAVSIQNEIFPEEDGRQNFMEFLNKDPYRKEQIYWIVYNDEIPIGVSGLYSYHEYSSVAWLGWFGILEKYRNKSYGSKVLDMTEIEAKKRGYTSFRLYTNIGENEEAIKLYTKRKMLRENYTNEKEIKKVTDTTIIFSKSLDGKDIELWNINS